MKQILRLVSVLLIVGFLFIFLNHPKYGIVPALQKKANAYAAQRDSFEDQNSNEGARRDQIPAAFRMTADLNDGDAFRKELSRLFSKEFTGDPKGVLENLEPYLTHSNERLRFELAKACLWAGIHNAKVIQVLCDFVKDEKNIPVEKTLPGYSGEKYFEDFRKYSAKLLANYRIKEALDPMWEAYQQTSDPIYLRHLAVFKDERVAQEAMNLIRDQKVKFIDLHSVFGIYKIQEAEKPLETVFRARQERSLEADQTELAWSIYQITRKQEYYDYLIQKKAYLNNTLLEVPDVLELLNATLRQGGGPINDTERRTAFLSLIARSDGRRVAEDYLVEFFDDKIKSTLDATLLYTSAAHLDEERVSLAAQRYEQKYGSGLWPYYSKRRGWPINDLISNFIY